jgi:hypothetical protein
MQPNQGSLGGELGCNLVAGRPRGSFRPTSTYNLQLSTAIDNTPSALGLVVVSSFFYTDCLSHHLCNIRIHCL